METIGLNTQSGVPTIGSRSGATDTISLPLGFAMAWQADPIVELWPQDDPLLEDIHQDRAGNFLTANDTEVPDFKVVCQCNDTNNEYLSLDPQENPKLINISSLRNTPNQIHTILGTELGGQSVNLYLEKHVPHNEIQIGQRRPANLSAIITDIESVRTPHFSPEGGLKPATHPTLGTIPHLYESEILIQNKIGERSFANYQFAIYQGKIKLQDSSTINVPLVIYDDLTRKPSSLLNAGNLQTNSLIKAKFLLQAKLK
jgi:hypothetical protein